MSEIKWIWLAEKCGIGSSDILTLVSRMETIEAIYNADYEKYISIGINERTADKLCDKALDGAYSVMSWCEKNKVGILAFDSDKFPSSLRALKNPPAVLYYIGHLPDFNRELCISVVGTRKMSEYGMKAAYKIAYELAAAGAVTVSGMALGIDGVAACASIAAGGRTVAVLGSGIDVVYPREHQRLYDTIAKRGTVITEYPPSTRPYGYNFPQRNRIISGLGVGTLVVDAPEGSGALITAKNAIIQGKDIYAVPGNIGEENTAGTNSLIRDGATAVLCGRDIIKSYAFLYRHSIDMQRLTRAEANSGFNPSELVRMKIGMRIARPDADIIPNERIQRREAAVPVGEKRTLAGEDITSASREYTDFEGAKSKPSRAERTRTKAQPDKKAEKAQPAPAEKTAGDNSQKILDSLSQRQREIFSEMPMDRPVTVDYFTKTGYAMGEVMSALTVLEIKGLISSLPGALYIRK